ncbi:unnamed protein product [Plutella xylostella]|uniref:(diamondback moth) hypothetical protein n=1 Tax=Plutella xylostella TaxID=51655 RepID=A0A8S4FDB3_PLUXY|nr:unnamed protein product [Plutella xylostella]
MCYSRNPDSVRKEQLVDCVVSSWSDWSECDSDCGAGSMVRTRRVAQAAEHGGRRCPALLQRRACHDHRGCRERSDLPRRAQLAWSSWSPCVSVCGAGSMVRTRRVAQAAEHGGRRCPALLQRRACHDHRGCRERSDLPRREEMAQILPGALSVSRHSNETVDIRKNLRLRNPDDPESNSHREYCIQFEVIKSSKACHLDSDYKALREGGKVSVLCETAALKRGLEWRCEGHGVAGHATRFSALVAPHCHGKWTRLQHVPRDGEPCRTPDFIFV